MRVTLRNAGTILVLAALVAGLFATPVEAAAPVAGKGRYVVIARNAGQVSALAAEARTAGGKVISINRRLGTVVVRGSASMRNRLAGSSRTRAIARDGIKSLIMPESAGPGASAGAKALRQRLQVQSTAARAPARGDPAFGFPGLLWNENRVNVHKAHTLGRPGIRVGVADTGLDFTHSELARKVISVVDFTTREDPPLCATFFPNPIDPTKPGIGDRDLARIFGGPATTDWFGHGSWIGGNIAGDLDGVGISGIAPRVSLVSLKISGWCGSAYDSTILDAFTYAADHHIDVVSISFGGYTDRSDPEQEAIWQLYVRAVRHARAMGTVIVASAGNEHVRIGKGGKVLSHGPLTPPGAPFTDLFGLYEGPGGVPGVVDVSSTGNRVKAASTRCPPPAGTAVTCKPRSDAHQPFGAGRANQLAYYSNYGPRIDVAGPGGARKFNLPVWDGGGTPGFPYTTNDRTTVWEDFSITSNWALQIDCFVFFRGPFYPNQCYSTIQGTSMATPHASAAIALIASAHPAMQHNVRALVARLKATTTRIRGNTTPPLSATDRSGGDLTGGGCSFGYCHLRGRPISDSDAYGAGLVSVADKRH
jgi:lantibiotic leader peptide-processing serine protease